MANLVELAGPEATVVVASDHGFGAQLRTFFVNTWLEEQGYLRWADGQGPRTSEQQILGMGQLARHTYLLDWRQTRAYAPMPSANGIHIVRADADHPHGVPDDDYERVRDHLIAGLYAVRDPDRDEPVVSRVWKREEVFAGPYLDLAPDLTLELTDGGLISILAAATPVASRPVASGAHRPEGIFIARGPGVRAGAELSELSILDVTPFLLYSMELPIMADLEGRMPTDALAPEARPVQTVQPDGAPEPAPTPAPQPQVEPIWDEEGEAEVLRRLQALGYVE